MFGRRKKNKRAQEAQTAAQDQAADFETPGDEAEDLGLGETTYIPDLSAMKHLDLTDSTDERVNDSEDGQDTGAFEGPGEDFSEIGKETEDGTSSEDQAQERKVLSRSERRKLEKQRKKEAKQAAKEARAQAKRDEENAIENVQIKPKANETAAQTQARLERKRRARRIRNRLKNFLLFLLILAVGGMGYLIYDYYNQVLRLGQEKADQKAAYEMELDKRDKLNRELSLGKEDLSKELEIKNETIEQMQVELDGLNTQIEEKNKMIESLAKNVQAVNDSFDALMKQVGGGSTQERLNNLENAIRIMNSDPNTGD